MAEDGTQCDGVNALLFTRLGYCVVCRVDTVTATANSNCRPSL